MDVVEAGKEMKCRAQARQFAAAIAAAGRMELGGHDVPSAFGPYPLLPESASLRIRRKPASRRLLASQVTSQEHRGPQSPVFPFHGGGVGVPNRRREEIEVLKHLERRVGSFRLKLRPEPSTDRLNENKTEPYVLESHFPLLRKIISHRPSIMNNNTEADTEWYTSDFIMECLCWHNVYRQRHGAPPLSMCPDLCSFAQDWANTLAHTNTFRYRNNCKDIGQNIYCRLNVKDPAEVAGQQVASYWYSGCRHYDYLRQPDVLHASVNTGHFTQMIWASTCDVGIGIARSRGGKAMVVAHYRPAGNWSGGFQENVPPPLAEFNSEVSSDYS